MSAVTVPMRERILVEAARLFSRQGYHHTSTRDIAAAVGIRQPSLFHHFPSKAAMLNELLEYSYGPTLAACELLAATEGPAAPRLHAYVTWDLSYVHRSPYDLHGLHTDAVLSDPDFAESRKSSDRLHGALQRMVEQGVAGGEFVEILPRLAQEIITGVTLANMRVHHEQQQGDAPDPAALAESAAALVLRGLLLRPGEYPAVRRRSEALSARPDLGLPPLT